MKGNTYKHWWYRWYRPPHLYQVPGVVTAMVTYLGRPVRKVVSFLAEVVRHFSINLARGLGYGLAFLLVTMALRMMKHAVR